MIPPASLLESRVDVGDVGEEGDNDMSPLEVWEASWAHFYICQKINFRARKVSETLLKYTRGYIGQRNGFCINILWALRFYDHGNFKSVTEISALRAYLTAALYLALRVYRRRVERLSSGYIGRKFTPPQYDETLSSTIFIVADETDLCH